MRRAGISVPGSTRVAWGLAVGDGILKVGEGCYIGPDCLFDTSASVELEDGAQLGPRCTFITSTHQIGASERRVGSEVNLPVRVGAGCWIGASVTVLPGVTVGSGAVIAAGALVKSDVEPDTLVAGVPARVVRRLA
jgi:maltose O-acetyltransferase